MIQAKYKPYPAYKPCGVEWLGEVPEGWECWKTKFVSDFINGYAFKSELYTDSGIPIIRIGDVAEEIDFESVKRFPDKNLIGLDKFKVLKGDLLLALTGATIGKAFEYKSSELAYLNQRVGILRGKKLNQHFLKYFFYSYTVNEIINYLCNGGAQENISKTQIGNIFAPLPPLPEQKTIADFLDRETARINGIVEKQTRMIELLKEKRSALITQAVTKGLNPKAKMKPSGVEWIEKIPEGWEVRRLRFTVKYNLKTLSDSTTNPKYEIEYLDIGNVDGEGNILSTAPMLFRDAPSRARRIVNNQNTIISTVRTYLKAIAYLQNIPENMIVSTGFAVISCNSESNPKYYFYLFRSNYFIEQVVKNSKGVGYPAITPSQSPSNLVDIPLIIPPLPEQQAIAAFLDRETAKIDALVGKIEKQIKLLNEYRQSLITSAVTGKIDVSTALNTSVRGEANAQNS